MQTCQGRQASPGDCYHYPPTYWHSAVTLPYEEMFVRCGTAPKQHRDSCKLGVGAEAIKRNMGEPEAIFSLCGDCRQMREQIFCVTGAVSMYVNQLGSAEEARQLCTQAPPLFSQACK